MESWELEALEGVRKALARYVISTDSGSFDEFLSLFAEDGVFVLPNGDSAVGPAGVASLLQAKSEAYTKIQEWAPAFLRHNITTTDIEILGPTEARVEAYFMVCTDRGLDHWGRWIDHLRMYDGRWLFQRREVHTEASYPDSWFGTVFSKV